MVYCTTWLEIFVNCHEGLNCIGYRVSEHGEMRRLWSMWYITSALVGMQVECIRCPRILYCMLVSHCILRWDFLHFLNKILTNFTMGACFHPFITRRISGNLMAWSESGRIPLGRIVGTNVSFLRIWLHVMCVMLVWWVGCLTGVGGERFKDLCWLSLTVDT